MGFRNWLHLVVSMIAMAGLAACSGQNFGLESQSQEFGHQVTYNTEVDVLMVIDTSSSMDQHRQSLADQMNGLISVLDRSRLDYRIGVTTMHMGASGTKGKFLALPEGSSPVIRFDHTDRVSVLKERVLSGPLGSTVERGLEAMKAALTAPNTEYDNAGFLRKDSLLVVLFLSNEEDESAQTPQDYIQFLDQIKPALPSGERSWVAHFIGVLPTDATCKTARWNYSDPGQRYINVVNASGGRSESICTADLRVAVDKIKARIIEMVTEYPLGDRKANPATIRVYVNGQLLAEDAVNGWSYNADKNSIVFHGAGVPLPGSMIHVDFDPEGIK